MYSDDSNSNVDFVIDQFEIFDRDQCQQLTSIVFECSQFWIKRARAVDFYTLGAAYYLDLENRDSTDQYVDAARKWNPILWDYFELFYQHLINRLVQRFDCDFRFHPNVALPGFHVFGPRPHQSASLFNKIFFQDGGTIHQHPTPTEFAEILEIPQQRLPEHLYSHTIPIHLPPEGAGLDIWPAGLVSTDRPPTYVPYQKGLAYGFQGELVHRIAPYRPGADSLAQNAHRITFQCHDLDLGDYRVLFF